MATTEDPKPFTHQEVILHTYDRVARDVAMRDGLRAMINDIDKGGDLMEHKIDPLMNAIEMQRTLRELDLMTTGPKKRRGHPHDVALRSALVIAAKLGFGPSEVAELLFDAKRLQSSQGLLHVKDQVRQTYRRMRASGDIFPPDEYKRLASLPPEQLTQELLAKLQKK